MKTYRHIFFDLDQTIWDFESNSAEALTELYHKHSLQHHGVEKPENFIKTYKHHNELLWEQYRYEKIDRETLRNLRFDNTFRDLGIEQKELSRQISDEYISLASRKTTLIPHAFPVLSYLKEKYSLHVITNGFEEVQFTKIRTSGLKKFFTRIITSEMAGCKKPDRKIFIHSLSLARAKRNESLMIGDSLSADIHGAKNAGLDQVFFNPGKKPHNAAPTYEINCLGDLKNIL